MFRFIPVLGLLVGLAIILTTPASVAAQKARQAMPASPPATPLANNFNNPNNTQLRPGGIVTNFTVTNPIGQGSNNGQNPGLANNANGMNYNPYNGGYGAGYNPYLNPSSALNPNNYNAMMYGPYANPYGANPYASSYNPNGFANTGTATGTTGTSNAPSLANLFNFNLNYQYLSNPYLNSLSNPAFSGPFAAGIFNSTAALNAIGFGNLLQNLPLHGGTPGNNQQFP